ncbi:MAG: hypothetical protein KF883_05105 [Thermomicrobiales bacterium]|nr:hypothetical protein [Thermomicrobiales bacterium]
MQFGRVYGRAMDNPECGAAGLRVEVTLESGSSLRVVRDECVSLPDAMTALHDLRWWADQFTQETIGTTLAEAGWEAIAAAEEPDQQRATSGSATVTYVVRRI